MSLAFAEVRHHHHLDSSPLLPAVHHQRQRGYCHEGLSWDRHDSEAAGQATVGDDVFVPIEKTQDTLLMLIDGHDTGAKPAMMKSTAMVSMISGEGVALWQGSAAVWSQPLLPGAA